MAVTSRIRRPGWRKLALAAIIMTAVFALLALVAGGDAGGDGVRPFAVFALLLAALYLCLGSGSCTQPTVTGRRNGR